MKIYTHDEVIQEGQKYTNTRHLQWVRYEDIRADIGELLEMIRNIPCNCDEIYTRRGLRSPDCPRCNWIEDDVVDKCAGFIVPPDNE